MYKVKYSTIALDIIDRQDVRLYNIIVVVKGIIELFACKARAKVHQQILTFSISYDYTSIRFYSHQLLIDENITF